MYVPYILQLSPIIILFLYLSIFFLIILLLLTKYIKNIIFLKINIQRERMVAISSIC